MLRRVPHETGAQSFIGSHRVEACLELWDSYETNAHF